MKIDIHLPHGGGAHTPDRIIIHAMAENIIVDTRTARKVGTEPGIYHAFRWLDVTGLSAHSLITPGGGNIRTRADTEMAWHAKNHNAGSLGIEFLVPGEYDYGGFLAAMKTDYLTEAAFTAGLDQIKAWVQAFNITEVKTHSEIDPGRKKDPGPGFPLDRLLEALQ